MFLSFVVPVYNAAQYLPECLDSLLAQDISDYEIICVNDGSRDASPEILGQYAAEHGNIRVINKENGGVVSARNAGLSAAQGDFIWFVDADDFLLPNILGFLKDKAAETACDRLIVGGYQFTDRLTDEEIALSRQRKLPINSQWYDSVVWRSLLRREFLLENGLNFRYPELTHGEDGLYMYEAGLCAPKSVEIKLRCIVTASIPVLPKRPSAWRITTRKSAPTYAFRKSFWVITVMAVRIPPLPTS